MAKKRKEPRNETTPSTRGGSIKQDKSGGSK